jgi:hypothetical protein
VTDALAVHFPLENPRPGSHTDWAGGRRGEIGGVNHQPWVLSWAIEQLSTLYEEDYWVTTHDLFSMYECPGEHADEHAIRLYHKTGRWWTGRR